MTRPAHLQRLLDLLDWRRSGDDPDQYVAKCPTHPDKDPSLSIHLGGDRKHPTAIMLRCWRGCATEVVVAELGLTMADLFVDSTRTGVIVERRHVYYDLDGTALYAVDRISVGGRRTWRYVHPSADGAWTKGRGNGPRVLYRWPDVQFSPGLPVWITEGERDADVLVRRGAVATTVASGTWDGVDLSVLSGRRVMIVVDNDRGGWKRGRAAMAAVQRAGGLLEGVWRPVDTCKDVACHYAEVVVGDLLEVDLDAEEPPRESWDDPDPKPPKALYDEFGLAIGVRTPVPLLLHYKRAGRLSEDGMLVWLVLADKAGATQLAHMTRSDIARKLGWGRVRVRAAVTELIGVDLVEDLRRGRIKVVNPCWQPTPLAKREVAGVAGIDTSRDTDTDQPQPKNTATPPSFPPRTPHTSPVSGSNQTTSAPDPDHFSSGSGSNQTTSAREPTPPDSLENLLDAFPGSDVLDE